MASEIFRFVNLRGPLQSEPDQTSNSSVILMVDKPSALTTDLARMRASSSDRSRCTEIAAKFIASDQYALRSALPVDIGRLDQWFSQQPTPLKPQDFIAGVREVLGKDIPSLISSSEYIVTRSRIADSALALTVQPGSNVDKAQLTRYLRLCGLLESISAHPNDIIDRDRVYRMRILLPPEVFPLPPSVNPHDADTETASEEQRKQRDQEAQARAKLAQQIADSQTAIAELSTALRADTNDLRQAISKAPPAQPPTLRREAPATIEATTGIIRPQSGPVSAGVLSSKGVSRLSTTTTTVLANLGVATDFVDVPYVVQSLEAVIASSSAKLFQGRKSRTVTRVGNQWIPGINPGLLPGWGDTWSSPGACVVAGADDPSGDGATVPSTTISTIRPVGVADLLLVQQEIKRYELGEIAHVENVMKSESRRREHREITRTTETVTVETETTTEESRDLETTNRYELQQESDAVIKEETSLSMSLSISGSYGPFASGTANITSSTGESKETTKKNAMNYARDVTDKAVKKVQNRVLQRRTVTTMNEIADISHHDFDNKQGQQHIQGIYRWLEKVYSAQVMSYGLRLMFELVVPEPSAFYRYALTASPPEGLTVELPDPPGYCHHPSNTFVPLVPSDLSDGNYQFWVSKYAVSGVSPPPPLHRTIGITLAGEPGNDDYVMIMNNDLQVPGGYAAERAWVGGEEMVWDGQTPPAFLSYHVGRTEIGVNVAGPMNGEDATIPVVGHGYKVTGFAVTIEVLCTRTPETLASWQLSTFNQIIGAYNDLKSQYDAALSRLELNAQSNTGISGKNPDENREIERRELKRQSISLLTNQHYDDFDAMRRGVPPYGYPQMNIVDATAEGGYIQFFEQAFEWVNMSYLFYPYFWARKSEWPNYLRQDDTDPLFGQFLQAGAARVQVPVTPGFEQAVLYLLQTGNKPWEEDDSSYQIQGSLYKSMVDEIVDEQLGAFNRGPGTIAVTQGSAAVTGTGTAFDAKLHLDRQIMIAYRVYRIADVASPTSLTLDRPYVDPSASGVAYSFGGRLVGDSWEVKVPTSLVFLQSDNALPVFTH